MHELQDCLGDAQYVVIRVKRKNSQTSFDVEAVVSWTKVDEVAPPGEWSGKRGGFERFKE